MHYHSYLIQHFGSANNQSIEKHQMYEGSLQDVNRIKNKKHFALLLMEFVGVRDIRCGALPGCRIGFKVYYPFTCNICTFSFSICPARWPDLFTTLPLLRYLSGRVFVLDLTPGSQADFDGFICRGDVIDEINGTSLRNSKSGQVS